MALGIGIVSQSFQL